MKKGLTEMVFILDRSGSMSGLEGDTIGGYNAMIEKQKEEEGEALVSTVLFDTRTQVLFDREHLDRVPAMTRKDYTPGGCTALLDAMGGAIHHIGNVHKYARPEDVPEKTLFVIITDGFENASRLYTQDQVRTMVERQKEKYGWEFIFLGANMDAIAVAGRYGIGADRAVTYSADAEGTEANFRAVSKAASSFRKAPCMSADWADEVKEDQARRKAGRNKRQPADTSADQSKKRRGFFDR